MRLRNYSMIFILTLLTGCSFLDPEVVVETKYITKEIPIKDRPEPPKLNNVEFRVITKETIDEFLKENEERFGNIVFFAITVPDYENLSLNVGELRRYIDQQRSLILYYENNLVIKQENINTDKE